MAEGKKSIIIYADWIKKFEALTDDEAGRLIKHLFRYVNDQNPEFPDRITELSFIDIEQSLKRDLVKWEQRAERSRENGKSGGRPSAKSNEIKPEETQQVILEPEKPVTVNVSGSVNDIGNVKKKKSITEPSVSVEKSKDVFNAVKLFYMELYLDQYRTDYYFLPKDAAKIKSIIKKVHFKMKERDATKDFTETELTEASQFFIKATMIVADSWLKSNMSTANIDTKFNEIYSSIKNPQNGITKTKQRSIFADQ